MVLRKERLMRTLISGILVLLVAGGLASWPDEAAANPNCIYNKVDCGGFTCASIGYTYTAYGTCLVQEQVLARECTVINNSANNGGSATTHQAGSTRLLCTNPVTGQDIYSGDCGDLSIRVHPAVPGCPKMWTSCGGIIVTAVGC